MILKTLTFEPNALQYLCTVCITDNNGGKIALTIIISALILNFITPMLLIQDRAAKRLKGQVLFVAILILIGHFIDVFVMIMPGTVGTHWHLGFVEIGTFLGYIGFFTKT